MIDIMQFAAREAGKILLSHFKHHVSVEDKTSIHDILTKADTEAQLIIYNILKERMEKKGFLSEEIGFLGEENLFKSGKYFFVIDPLDGTANFASGIEEFAVSIALFIDNVLSYGVIYHPITDDMYYSEKGKGTFRIRKQNEEKITIHKIEPKDMLFLGSFAHGDSLRKKQFHLYEELFPLFRAFLSINATVPAIVKFLDTSNTLGLVIGGAPKIWDIAASNLIVREAGGVMKHWDGSEMELDISQPEKGYSMITCHPNILPIILERSNKLAG